jgi:DNA-binding NarL/FixJ family response regulator
MQSPGPPADRLIRILVADFDPMTTRLLVADLRRQQSFEVFECPPGTDQVCKSLTKFLPSVLLLNGESRDTNTDRLRLLRCVRLQRPEVRVVLFLDEFTRGVISELFRAGARGVFESSDYESELLGRCIRCVAEGQIWAKTEHLVFVMDAFAETASYRLFGAKSASLLTPRERDVVQLVADGFGNREIAERLGLSPHTIKNYLFNVFEKLGVSSRAELIMYVLAGSDRALFEENDPHVRPKATAGSN